MVLGEQDARVRDRRLEALLLARISIPLVCRDAESVLLVVIVIVIVVVVVVVDSSHRGLLSWLLNATFHVSLLSGRMFIFVALLTNRLESIAFTPEVVCDSGQGLIPTWVETGRILDNVWLDGCERLSKFSETELGIPIEVKSTHDGNELLLERLVTGTFQKASNRDFIDNLVVLVVDCLEGTPDREGFKLLEVLLQLLESQFKIDLLCE